MDLPSKDKLFFCVHVVFFFHFLRNRLKKTISCLKNVCSNIISLKKSDSVIHLTVTLLLRGYLKMIFKKVGGDVRMDLFCIFIKSMHEFDSKMSCGSLKNSSKTAKSNVLTVIASYMAFSRCQFHTKRSRNLLTY